MMNNSKYLKLFNRQLSLVTYVLIFLVLQIVIITLLLSGRRHVVTDYQRHLTEGLNNDFHFTLTHYRDLSQLIFQTNLNQPQVLALLKQAPTASPAEQTVLRTELFEYLEPLFTVIQNRFRQVHFHFPDGTSFLRLHKPDLYGDNLNPFRESIRRLDTNKKFLEGFELGRHFYAIRYIYPFFDTNGSFLGSVEMGVSFQQFRSSLYELSHAEHLLLIRSEIGEEKISKQGKKNFQNSLLSDTFIMEKADSVDHEYLKGNQHKGHISSSEISRISKKIRQATIPHLAKHQAFSIATKLAKQNYQISFLPLQNIVGRDVGYLVRYNNDSTVSLMKREYFLAYLVSTALVLALLLLYRWATNKIFSQLSYQQNLLDAIPTPIFYTDSTGICVGSNDSFAQTFGTPDPTILTAQAVAGKNWQKISRECINALQLTGEREWAEKEIVFTTEKQGTKTFYCYKARFANPTDNTFGLIGTLFDISERKKAEKELKQSHEEIQQIFNTAADGMRVVDRDHNVLLVNERFAKMCGVPSAELLNLKCYDIFGGSNCLTNACPLNKILAGENWVESEVIKKMQNGREIPCILTATPHLDSNGNVIGIIEDFKDISERKALESQLEKLSRTDDLTGLLNRRGFIQDSEKMIRLCRRQKQNIFLIFADLDNMKNINDTLSHEKGDLALQTTAQLLRNTYRETDIIGRLGGDEFAILLIDSLSDEKQYIVDRFHNRLREWNNTSTEKFELALSMGIVQSDANQSETIVELLQRADQRMYEVKKERKAKETPEGSMLIS